MSLRTCLELWGHETSLSALHQTLQSNTAMLAPYFKPSKSFKVEVESFGNHFTQKEKIEKIEVSF